MNLTKRIATSAVDRQKRSTMGRLSAVVMQCVAMIGIGATSAADQPNQLVPSPRPASKIEIVPGQQAFGAAGVSGKPGADVQAVKPLRAISTDIGITGEAPADVAAPSTGPDQTVGGREVPRGFGDSMYFWQASNMVHRPLYYEQRYVERYGANFGPMQPIASGVQVAADTALLPVKMLVHPPRECVYSLGYGRPGSSGTRCPRY